MSKTASLYVDLLVDKNVAVDHNHAQRIIDDLAVAGFAVGPKDVLSPDQRVRAEALSIARRLVVTSTGLSSSRVDDPDALVPLARYIETGSEYEEDIRIAAAETRAANEAAPVEVTGGHVCQAVPDMPAGEDPGPLGAFQYATRDGIAASNYDRPS